MGERPRSRSFGPTVLGGLAAAVLTAVAAARDWSTASGSAAGVDVTAAATGSASAPLGVALGLVALASWGVVLVLRGWMRRAVAAVGALASAGVVAAVVAAFHSAQRDAVHAVTARGGTGAASSSLTGWYYVCGVAAALTLVAFVVAVLTCPRWPAMGSRYDAPTARAPGAASASGQDVSEQDISGQDMWHALDDGRDPTA
jgi:uncharacterized membrane protein (TIGR02234 family)